MADRKSKKALRPIRKPSIESKNSSNILNLFRYGESYSSLLLGIIVVIITTILLVLLVRDRNVNQVSDSQKNISSTNTEIARTDLTPTNAIATGAASASTMTPTAPTSKPTVLPTKKSPTVIPTKLPTSVKTQPTKVIPTNSPQALTKTIHTHTVSNGENLWTIAEKYYRSGYNWVDISRANKLSNPGVIVTGMKLSIPDVKAKQITVIAEKSDQTTYGPKITGTTYKIEKGDHLWGIAVRAFNDGYKWVEIAKVNNIKTPGIIQPGLVLKIPRTVTPQK